MHAVATLDDRILRHRGELLAFLRRRSPSAAEELAQEVWLRVASANPDCPTEAKFRGYVFAVARRLLIDHYRRSRARIQLVPIDGSRDVARSADDPFGAACAGQTLRMVQEVLARMTPEQAQVFRWRVVTDLSFKDIAARQGVGLNTALGRMHSATKKIRAALVDAGLEPGGQR